MNCFITDIDNTIADTRDRLKRSLSEIGRPEVFAKTADRYGGFGDYLDEEEKDEFWSLFLSNKFLHLDKPAPESAAILNEIKNEGIDIIYLTGRHDEKEDSMLSGTRTWLNVHGFPSPECGRVNLFMKPRRKMVDREFKLAKLQNLVSNAPEQGEVVGVGDHPDDALVYNRVGIEPVLINWLGLFSNQELRSSVSGVKIVENWSDLQRELFS